MVSLLSLSSVSFTIDSFAPAQIIMLRNSLAVAGKEKRPIKRLYWGGLTLMTALSLLTSRRAIAVSDYARKALTFGLGERFKNKVTVIHHGVSKIFVSDNTVSRKNYLLAVSDIYVQKNLHTLIQALSKIRENFPDIILKIAGKAIDEGYLQELRIALDQAHLNDAVEFLGEKKSDELLKLYQECKLFIFPSTVETFGNPLVEAMACGVPVVAPRRGTYSEMIERTGGGVLVSISGGVCFCKRNRLFCFGIFSNRIRPSISNINSIIRSNSNVMT